jgi:pyruvate kinase
MCEVYPSLEVLFYTAKRMAKDRLNLKLGDKLIITGGSRTGESGCTNTIRVEEI